mgnify:CR=1 FL=1
MATVVNNPSESSSGMGFLLGMIVLVVMVFLLFFYGLPLLTQATRSAGTQVNVPDKIDVNVQNPAQQPK